MFAAKSKKNIYYSGCIYSQVVEFDPNPWFVDLRSNFHLFRIASTGFSSNFTPEYATRVDPATSTDIYTMVRFSDSLT